MPRKPHEFTVVTGGVDELSDELIDAIYEAGCDDGLLCHGNGGFKIDSAREAESLEAAVRSAIADVQTAGLKVHRVETDDFRVVQKLNAESITSGS